MAMIVCPECGKEISSNAKACPHCGCEVTVCPDCGAVYAGQKETCDTCGCLLKQRERTAPTEKSRSESFRKRAEHYQIIDTMVGVASIVLLVAAALIALFAIPKMAGAMTEGGLEIVEMKKKYDDLHAVIVLCGVMLALYGGGYLFELIAQHIFGTRIKNAREDYRAFVFDVEEKSSASVFCAIEFAEAPENAKKRYLLPALKLLCDIVAAVLLCVWAVGTADTFYNEWFLSLQPDEVKFVWDFLDVKFLLGCAFVLVGEVAGFLHKRRESSDTHLIAIQDPLKK